MRVHDRVSLSEFLILQTYAYFIAVKNVHSLWQFTTLRAHTLYTRLLHLEYLIKITKMILRCVAKFFL